MRPDARALGAVAAGGALGTALRYWIARAHPPPAGGMPWATLAINLSGSFVLGVLLTFVLERWPPTRYVRPFAAIGCLGAFTTFSTFAVESDLLIRDGRVGIAIGYGVASLAGGVVAAAAGVVVGRAWPAIGRRA